MCIRDRLCFVALLPKALTTRAIGRIALISILLMVASLLVFAWEALP